MSQQITVTMSRSGSEFYRCTYASLAEAFEFARDMRELSPTWDLIVGTNPDGTTAFYHSRPTPSLESIFEGVR